MAKENLNWAVLGTGVIANQMAEALQKMGKNWKNYVPQRGRKKKAN